VADPAARSLRTRQTYTVGLVSDEIATTPYAGRLIQGAQDAAWRRGVLLLLLTTGGDAAHEREAISTLLHRRVDGIVYATMYHRVVEAPAVRAGTPLVLLDARPAAGRVPCVVPDERAGAATAVAELIGRGHRRIGFVQNHDDVPASHERLDGYRRTLEAHGIAYDGALVAADEPSAAGGRRALSRLLELTSPPTAVFCFNDRMAMGVYQLAHARGRRVPKDLSVVGFDDQADIADALWPGLTTVALPHYDMGAWAVHALLEPPRPGGVTATAVEMRMPCPLIRRESVAGPPGGTAT
jgi:LacI family transcriptional regulator